MEEEEKKEGKQQQQQQQPGGEGALGDEEEEEDGGGGGIGGGIPSCCGIGLTLRKCDAHLSISFYVYCSFLFDFGQTSGQTADSRHRQAALKSWQPSHSKTRLATRSPMLRLRLRAISPLAGHHRQHRRAKSRWAMCGMASFFKKYSRRPCRPHF